MNWKTTAVLLVCVGLLAAGCSSASKQVNEAAIAQAAPVPPSISSARDRELAAKTFAALPFGTEDYQIGPNDVLEIGVFEWEMAEQTKTLAPRVSQEGIISLPLIGDLNVSGKTVREVRVLIEKALIKGDFIKNPRVSVVIREFRSKRVSITGAVKDPGMYTLQENVTRLVDLLSLAGGLSDLAGQRCHVLKADPAGTRAAGDGKDIITVDLYYLLRLGDQELNLVLGNGDVVHVPKADKFFVYGYVHQPGAYDLKHRTTALEALAMAGGLVTPEASPSACVVRRGPQEIPVDIEAITDREAPDIYLQGDDILEVRQTTGRRVWLTLWEGFKSIFHIGVGWNLNN
ncbi:MAG: polysaccharide biosynthesis/export family protein [Planctomycetota bacterium]